MPNSTGKGTTDADISSLRALFHEMEEEEVVDCTLCGHECARAPACGDGAAATDSACLICGFHPSVWYKGLVLVQVPVLITLCVIWCVPRCGLL